MGTSSDGLRHRLLRAAGLTVAAILAGCVAGCEPVDETPTPSAPAPPAPAADSPWHRIGGSARVAVEQETEQALQAAYDEARRTAGEARRRWAAASVDDRRRWAVKWRAPTVSGGVEYVWVVPAVWTPDRVEGFLASSPQETLLCGRDRGEVVSFAVDELVDWVHLLEADAAGRREGGFTMRALEKQYGPPGGG